jgi:hypothetical protein
MRYCYGGLAAFLLFIALAIFAVRSMGTSQHSDDTATAELIESLSAAKAAGQHTTTNNQVHVDGTTSIVINP